MDMFLKSKIAGLFSVYELNDPLNRDWRYYSCGTPYSAMSSKGSFSCDSPSLSPFWLQ